MKMLFLLLTWLILQTGSSVAGRAATKVPDADGVSPAIYYGGSGFTSVLELDTRREPAVYKVWFLPIGYTKINFAEFELKPLRHGADSTYELADGPHICGTVTITAGPQSTVNLRFSKADAVGLSPGKARDEADFLEMPNKVSKASRLHPGIWDKVIPRGVPRCAGLTRFQ